MLAGRGRCGDTRPWRGWISGSVSSVRGRMVTMVASMRVGAKGAVNFHEGVSMVHPGLMDVTTVPEKVSTDEFAPQMVATLVG